MGLWTLTHLWQIVPTFLAFAVLTFIAAKLLGKRSEKVRKIPLQVITVILLVLEVLKQINSFGEDGTYNMYSLPFHYCSLFLYLLPFHSFYQGKYKPLVSAATFGCLASLMLDMILMPAVIYPAYQIVDYAKNFASFHTVTFHNLVVLYFMLTVAFKLYDLQTKRDVKVMTVFLAIYVAIAAVLSYTLKVNFHNLYSCNIPFIENVRVALVNSIGVFGTIIYVTALFILTILFAYLSYALARLVIKGIDKCHTAR